jgi:hypothetical protein
MAKPRELIPIHEARELLGVSKNKMTKLLQDKILRHWTSPLDSRLKLVNRKEVLALLDRKEVG